jgi:hypothetical protein
MLQLVLKAKLPYLQLLVHQLRELVQALPHLVLQELGLASLRVVQVLLEL